MDTLSYKTISANKENADKKWLLVDAEGQTLGRLASEVAKRKDAMCVFNTAEESLFQIKKTVKNRMIQSL